MIQVPQFITVAILAPPCHDNQKWLGFLIEQRVHVATSQIGLAFALDTSLPFVAMMTPRRTGEGQAAKDRQTKRTNKLLTY
jgi:hypothetical protein